MKRGAYLREVARRLDVDWTLHNRRALMAWCQTEGPARNNALNTTEDAPAATTINSAGVKDYASAEEGIAATVRTFHHKGVGYEAILSAMRRNAPAAETLRAVGRSSWGTAGTLAMTIRAELARIPSYLQTLENKEIPQ